MTTTARTRYDPKSGYTASGRHSPIIGAAVLDFFTERGRGGSHAMPAITREGGRLFLFA